MNEKYDTSKISNKKSPKFFKYHPHDSNDSTPYQCRQRFQIQELSSPFSRGELETNLITFDSLQAGDVLKIPHLKIDQSGRVDEPIRKKEII
jgi:hypothetical protein